jgi:hypothetical protein
VALIQPFDAPVNKQLPKDDDLGFYRLRAQPRKKSEFFFIDSIIRGALIADDFDSEEKDEKFVIDVAEPDFFLRVQSMYSQT